MKVNFLIIFSMDKANMYMKMGKLKKVCMKMAKAKEFIKFTKIKMTLTLRLRFALLKQRVTR